jgi:hypothetical protein
MSVSLVRLRLAEGTMNSAAADDRTIPGIYGEYRILEISQGEFYEIILDSGARPKVIGYATSEKEVADTIREYELGS